MSNKKGPSLAIKSPRPPLLSLPKATHLRGSRLMAEAQKGNISRSYPVRIMRPHRGLGNWPAPRALNRLLLAGQVYGVPLSGPLLTKSAFPDQKACEEDFRRKWIKVRPALTSVSSGAPDKAQFARADLWTKDVIEYLHLLVDKFFSKDGLTDNSSKPSPVSTLIEMLQWFIFAFPDTFIALDCFPLPNYVAPDLFARSNSMKVENVNFGNRGSDHQYWSFGSVVSSIQKRFANLAKIVNPGVQGYGMAKALQALDKALIEDKHLKTIAFVPLRARLFLNALVDCQMPPFTLMKEDGSWVSGPSEPRAYAENETKLLDQLVHVLDTLQPAKFHCQWVELRLLLNEQTLLENIETQNILVEAITSLSPKAENFSLSENERNFLEIVLTRLLVRQADARSLYLKLLIYLERPLRSPRYVSQNGFF
ncbi:hypothetical protein J5N97_022634 [Dioscorea zingiberensis]|uniref:Uncharacterized protein n=1 Tax=Dioscorea zingiberensis TaxID=325984 RepID=A0A9D5CAV1_9LILI|nr:hypothetical protein J5N97_022634 [Dioscorea zingiberensis]